MDYRAVTISISEGGVRLHVPGGQPPAKFESILKKQGFSPVDNYCHWTAGVESIPWIKSRLYPSFQQYGATLEDGFDAESIDSVQPKDDDKETTRKKIAENIDKQTIKKLVKEVESLKKLSAELNKRLEDLKKKKQ